MGDASQKVSAWPTRSGAITSRRRMVKRSSDASIPSGPVKSPPPRLYRKSRGQGAQLCYQSHILMENRNGLIVDHELTPASGTGERKAAVDMVTRLPGNHRVTVGADRGYDSADFIDDLRCRNATSHVAQNTKNRRSAIERALTHSRVAECGVAAIPVYCDATWRWARSFSGDPADVPDFPHPYRRRVRCAQPGSGFGLNGRAGTRPCGTGPE